MNETEMPGGGVDPRNPLSQDQLTLVNAMRRKFGLPLVHMTHPRKMRSFYVSQQAVMGLQALAVEQHLTTSRGGSASALLEAIGLGVYDIVPREAAPPDIDQEEEVTEGPEDSSG